MGALETNGRRQEKASLEIKVPGSSRGAALSFHPWLLFTALPDPPKSGLPATPFRNTPYLRH